MSLGINTRKFFISICELVSSAHSWITESHNQAITIHFQELKSLENSLYDFNMLEA